MSERSQWSSKLGFILAASGSAIGLGNIVFFSANAYRFGAGAFYVPYLVALFVVGLPVLVLELGLGSWSGRSFPEAMRLAGGRPAELAGWFGLGSATFITMYYITILGWVLGMWVGALGEDLWAASVALPAFGDAAAGGLPAGAVPNPIAFFFDMLSSWRNVAFVVLVWVANLVITWRGASSIEAAVKLFVPLMWVFMVVMILRGVTLDGGVQGVYLLFTPDFDAMSNPAVWHGAFSQIFFTLSLGFGIMTAYASYLPARSDQAASGLMIASMNCAFEFIAGLAIFSMLFAFSMVPKASTLSMMFFIVPQGIASFPTGAKLFGVLFFTLLLVAGLSSSVSLVEALTSALQDKLRAKTRAGILVAVCVVGALGSALFAWPKVIDPGLDGDGTMGLTFLDLMDHWAFSYGLLLTGLVECVVVGWVLGPAKIRDFLNAHGRLKIPAGFDALVKWVIPGVLIGLLIYGVVGEVRDGLYGVAIAGAGRPYAIGALAVWLVGSLGFAAAVTFGVPGDEGVTP
ncbi:MAG: sodium-dependent transporter [Alphaproteobacteria bacterium]|nr:sodium-dependent transporter [Alphaproteobacteria bacterium]